jgi:hypothetical protein
LKEDATRRRCDRALERLRTILQRHGLASTASVIILALGNEVVFAAPAGLATTITSTALAEAASGAALSLGLSLVQLMSTTRVLIAVTVATIALIAVSAIHHAMSTADSSAALNAATSRFAAERKAYESDVAHAQAPVATPIAPSGPRSGGSAEHPALAPTSTPPTLQDSYRRHIHAFWHREFASFFAERHMTPEEIAQFVSIISPDPEIKTFRDEKGRTVLSSVTADVSHQDENLRTMLGVDGYDAFKAFQKRKESQDLAGIVSAMALFAGRKIEVSQNQRLASIIAQNDQGTAVRWAGTPDFYDWEVIATQARTFLTEDQMAALDAVRLQTSYKIASESVQHPDLKVGRESP